MKKIVLLIFLVVNIIIGSLLGGIYISGGILLDSIYISIFCLNFVLIIISLYILYVVGSNNKLKSEIEKSQKAYKQLSEEEKKFQAGQKKEREKQSLKEFQENFKSYIHLGIGLGILVLIVNYWEYILGFFFIIFSLIYGGVSGILESLTSIKGLLIVIVLLLIVIIKKLNNKTN